MAVTLGAFPLFNSIGRGSLKHCATLPKHPAASTSEKKNALGKAGRPRHQGRHELQDVAAAVRAVAVGRHGVRADALAAALRQRLQQPAAQVLVHPARVEGREQTGRCALGVRVGLENRTLWGPTELYASN